jgi:hypothetical protein
MAIREQLEAKFRAAASLKKLTIDGLDVFVRAITCAEKELYQIALADRQPNSVARFCCLVLADGDGNRIYPDTEVDKLAAFPAKALDEIWEEGLAFNRMGGGGKRRGEKPAEKPAAGNAETADPAKKN